MDKKSRKASDIRYRQGFYRPGGEAARIKPTTGQDDRPKKRREAPTRLVNPGVMFRFGRRRG